MSSQDEVFCLCRQKYDDKQFMIECNGCKDWFHENCINISEEEASEIDRYYCPTCEINNPIVYKKPKGRNHKHNESSNNDNNKPQTILTGSKEFIEILKQREFQRAEDIPMMRLQGDEVNKAYFEEFGFDEPILVASTRHLNVRLPASTFSISDVEHCVGSTREIDVIDVSIQEDSTMTMRKWTDYYNTPQHRRRKILNVISLEFSNTKLCDYVSPPEIVRDISWVNSYWPVDDNDDCYIERPEVQRYCLMGVANSYTDFHIDFGGTSVWYHVLKGEKIFYMVRPTSQNLSLYETWASSSKQGEKFFGDMVDYCYKCVIKQGETVFIPTGWIHAVFTPVDSLVFGGNFLHSYNIGLQLQIYEIEKSINSPEKFMFPNFEAINWFASKRIYEELKETRESGELCPQYLVDGLRSLSLAMREWVNNKNMVYMPESLQCGKLFKDIQKENKYLSKSPIKTQNLKVKLSPPTQEDSASSASSMSSSIKAKKRSNTTKKRRKHHHHRHRHHRQPRASPSKTAKQEVDDPSYETTTTTGGIDPAAYDRVDYTDALDDDEREGGGDGGEEVTRRNAGSVHYKCESDSFSDSDGNNLYIDIKDRGKRKSNHTFIPKLNSAANKEPLDPMNRFGSPLKYESTMSFNTNVPRQSGDSSSTATGSIADILQAANCYSSALSSKVKASIFSPNLPPHDNNTHSGVPMDEIDTSPSRTDAAIEGMLSMSRAATIKSDMDNCYDDDDFVYPTLDISDEDTVKDTRDDKPWTPAGSRNPAAGGGTTAVNHSSTSPQPTRRQRQGVKRESMESALAAASSKLDTHQPAQEMNRKFAPDDTPSTSSSTTNQNNNNNNKVRKLKGSATAKQRLGKILKLKNRVIR